MLLILKPSIFAALILVSQVPAYLDGNKLLVLCESEEAKAHGLCMAYVQGVVDHSRVVDIQNNKPACAPKATGRQVEMPLSTFSRLTPKKEITQRQVS